MCEAFSSYRLGPVSVEKDCSREAAVHIATRCPTHGLEWFFICERHASKRAKRIEASHSMEPICHHPMSVPTEDGCILPEDVVEEIVEFVREATREPAGV